jgi:hypothetical protein
LEANRHRFFNKPEYQELVATVVSFGRMLSVK